MVETRRIFDGEDYLRRMNDAALDGELDSIDHYEAEDDTPDRRKFKTHIRDIQVDITRVRHRCHAGRRPRTAARSPVD